MAHPSVLLLLLVVVFALLLAEFGVGGIAANMGIRNSGQIVGKRTSNFFEG